MKAVMTKKQKNNSKLHWNKIKQNTWSLPAKWCRKPIAFHRSTVCFCVPATSMALAEAPQAWTLQSHLTIDLPIPATQTQYTKITEADKRRCFVSIFGVTEILCYNSSCGGYMVSSTSSHLTLLAQPYPRSPSVSESALSYSYNW